MKEKRSKSNETKAQLLDCGISLIQRGGFHGTGISDLVKSAGIPKGSFYYYFDCKEQFAAEAVKEYMRPFLETLEEIASDTSTPALTSLKQYFSRIARDIQEKPEAGGCLLGNLLGELDRDNKIALVALAEVTESYKALIARLVLRAQREGDIRNDLDHQTLAGIVFDAWQGAILRSRVDQSGSSMIQFADHFFTSLLSPVGLAQSAQAS